MSKLEKIEKALGIFLSTYKKGEENYMNCDDPSDYNSGNEDDARDMGYDVGSNNAREDLIEMLEKEGIFVKMEETGVEFDIVHGELIIPDIMPEE